MVAFGIDDCNGAIEAPLHSDTGRRMSARTRSMKNNIASANSPIRSSAAVTTVSAFFRPTWTSTHGRPVPRILVPPTFSAPPILDQYLGTDFITRPGRPVSSGVASFAKTSAHLAKFSKLGKCCRVVKRQPVYDDPDGENLA